MFKFHTTKFSIMHSLHMGIWLHHEFNWEAFWSSSCLIFDSLYLNDYTSFFVQAGKNSSVLKSPLIIINREKVQGACIIIAQHKFAAIEIKSFLLHMHDSERFSDGDVNYSSFSRYTLNWKKVDSDRCRIILLRQQLNCKYQQTICFPYNMWKELG